MKKFIQKIFDRKYFVKITLPIILVIILIIIALFSFQKPQKTLSPDQAKVKAETFINKYLMTGSAKAKVKNVSTEYGLYKLKVDIVSSVVESYLTKDGKLFFPQALDINKIEEKANNSNSKKAETPSQVKTVTTKSNKPNVDLFVMSYCPYGTQIEKGILPVLSTLNNKINFKLRFVDYSMHGSKELKENLTQYCIQKDEPQKLTQYLACFLKAGNSDSCLKTVKINKTKIDNCIKNTDNQYKITANANKKINYRGAYPSFPIDQADNQKYNVLGSPTLVINDSKISSNRDPESLLKTICSAFKKEPKECQKTLSSLSPAPGLGNVGGSANNNTGSATCN